MAITTIDQALSGSKPPIFFGKTLSPTLSLGRHQSFWGLGGFPGAGSFDTTLAGVALSSTAANIAGQIPFSDPVSGNCHLSRFQAACSITGSLILADRLWHNGGFNITLTTAQALTSATFPSRDNNQTNNGEGILLGVEVSAATGAGTPTITVSYTNQAGVSGRTATNIVTTAASAVAGTFHLLSLQSGDTGVRSVQSLTLSATWTSGTINLVAFRPIATIELINAYVPNSIDALTGGFPQMFNGSVPFMILLPSSSSAAYLSGQLVYSHG